MATPYVALNGTRATAAHITIPFYGTWVADVTLASDVDLSQSTVLSVGDLSLSGAVFRMSSFAGARTVRLVGGHGGWGKPVTSQCYRDLTGIRLSTVLGDAARIVGEVVSLSEDRTLGTTFTRASGPAQRLLRLLAGATWWVDATGVTKVGARPPTTIKGAFDVLDWSGAKGRFSIATESIAEWMPGASFTTATVPFVQVVGATSIEATNDGSVRLAVLSAGQAR